MPASSASEKLALGKQYTNMLSLLTDCQSTSSPSRLYFHLNVSFLCIFPLSFTSPSLLAIYKSFQWQKGWSKEDRPPKHRCKWTVVFLLKGFRMIKTLSVHRTLLSVTEDYPSLDRQATEKMSIFAWSHRERLTVVFHTFCVCLTLTKCLTFNS